LRKLALPTLEGSTLPLSVQNGSVLYGQLPLGVHCTGRRGTFLASPGARCSSDHDGVDGVDTGGWILLGKRKGELRPGTVLTLVDQSKFEVHTTAIHRDLVGWHWKLVGGDEDRLEAIVEVFNYGDSPVHAYLTRVDSPLLARDCL
jgi:hypothetical protein